MECTKKKCSEPETVGNFIMGDGAAPETSAIFVNGVRKKGSEPETVGDFIMGVHRA